MKKRIEIQNFKKTSAKDNIGINELFDELVEKMFINNKKSSGKNQKIKKLEGNKKKQKQCCSTDF